MTTRLLRLHWSDSVDANMFLGNTNINDTFSGRYSHQEAKSKAGLTRVRAAERPVTTCEVSSARTINKLSRFDNAKALGTTSCSLCNLFSFTTTQISPSHYNVYSSDVYLYYCYLLQLKWQFNFP